MSPRAHISPVCRRHRPNARHLSANLNEAVDFRFLRLSMCPFGGIADIAHECPLLPQSGRASGALRSAFGGKAEIVETASETHLECTRASYFNVSASSR